MIEIFKDTNYDFLGKKWICIGLSCLLLLAGASSVAWRLLDGDPNTHPFNLGVDFAGGTIVNAKFREKPDPNAIRAAIEQQGIEGPKIVIQPVGDEIGQAPKNEVLIRIPNLVGAGAQPAQPEASAVAAGDTDIGGQKIRAALASLNDPAVAQNKVDVNAVDRDKVKEKLLELDPLGLRAGGATQSADARYAEIAARIIDYREKQRDGLIRDIGEVKSLSGLEAQLAPAFDQHFFAGVAAIKSTDAVSAQVGSDLRNRAVYVTLLACAGMLLYVAFRFKSWGYGIGAVVAVFHDVLVTVGIFSITQWEINLTVIAALLTLVGFSMNDTIVIFDRVREMLRLRRREKLERLTNEAVNQTLSRTVITNGTTFLTVTALVLFGGEVLKSFSWALFIGVIVGTYSTVYIASPVMLWWEGRKSTSRLATAGTAPSPAAVSNAGGGTAATAIAATPRTGKGKKGKKTRTASSVGR
jgi:preprotein translocase subunit SecF